MFSAYAELGTGPSRPFPPSKLSPKCSTHRPGGAAASHLDGESQVKGTKTARATDGAEITTLAADGHDTDGAGCGREFYSSDRSRSKR